MAKEVTGSMRATDVDREAIAERLKSALDEGCLTLAEYDDRVRVAYGARTYADLRTLIADLPRPGMSAAAMQARRDAEARRLPTALLVLWTIWAAAAAINLVVYALVSVADSGLAYPWPVWLLVPGVALGVVTVGVQVIRRR